MDENPQKCIYPSISLSLFLSISVNLGILPFSDQGLKTIKDRIPYPKIHTLGPFIYPRTLSPGPFTPRPIPWDHCYRTHTLGPFTSGPLSETLTPRRFTRDPYSETIYPGTLPLVPIPRDHSPPDPYPGTICLGTHPLGPFTPGPFTPG